MDAVNVTFGLALLAGLASFLLPCVLALIPAYIGYLGGRSVSPDGTVVENRWVTFSHGVAFVIGFSLIFITLGAEVQQLYRNRTYPSSFFVDREGVIQIQHIGVMTESQLDGYLAELGLGS